MDHPTPRTLSRASRALAVAALVLVTSACDSIAVPTVEEVIQRVGETLAKPPAARSKNTTTLVIGLADGADAMLPAEMATAAASVGGIGATVTLDTEQWMDGSGRSRVEGTMSTDLGAGGDSGQPMALDDVGFTTVNDGRMVSSYVDNLNKYFTIDLAEAERQMRTNGLQLGSPEQLNQLMKAAIAEVLQKYDIRVKGLKKTAGRQALSIEALPKDPSGKTELFDMLMIDSLTADIDLLSWQPLAMDLTGSVDAAAIAANAGAGDLGTLPRPTLRFTTQTTEIDYDAPMPAERFAFVPPSGAEQVEPEDLESSALPGLLVPAPQQ